MVWYEWIYGQKHIDGDRTVVDSEQPRSVVNHSEINTADKLENEIRNHFGKALADRYIEALNPYDSNGELWINVAWGVGDNFLAIKDHRLKKVNDSEYILTLIMDNTMENKTFEEKLLCTVKDEKWVFTNYVESSPEYILGVWEFSTYPDVENQYKEQIEFFKDGTIISNRLINQIPGLDPKFDKNRKGTYRIYESTIVELSFDDGEKKFLTLEPGGNLYGNMPYYDSEKGWYEYIQYWEKTAGTDSSIAVHFTKCNAR